eukprot:14021860-Alexandrium_andersonii.AAC.1
MSHHDVRWLLGLLRGARRDIAVLKSHIRANHPPPNDPLGRWLAHVESIAGVGFLEDGVLGLRFAIR